MNFKLQCAGVFVAMKRLGRPASIAEIAHEASLSYETARVRLKALEVAGVAKSDRPDMRKPSRWWVA